MSRVGKYPVVVPAGVELTINNNVVTAKGKLGELHFAFDDSHISAKLEDGKVVVTPHSLSRLPNIRQPSNPATEGKSNTTKMVTTIGKMIFVAFDTCLGLSILTSRSFLVVKSLIIGG